MPGHLKRYNQPGHTHFWTISCFQRLNFFHRDELKTIVVSALRLLEERFNICLVGYVIMPEHIHVVIYPHARGNPEPTDISKLLNAFKQHVGYYGKQFLRDYWRAHHRLWSSSLTNWALEDDLAKPIWTTRGYDFNIDRYDTLIEKLNYCHANPVTRGLVERADDWSWSSFRFYDSNDRSLLAMGWDGSWPIEWSGGSGCARIPPLKRWGTRASVPRPSRPASSPARSSPWRVLCWLRC